MKAKNNIASVYSQDNLEMRVVYHAKKMYEWNVVKVLFMVIILGLLSFTLKALA